MKVNGQLYATAAVPSGKEPPVSTGLEAGWAPEPVGGFREGYVRPVASRHFAYFDPKTVG
jgi:hypothetical protein